MLKHVHHYKFKLNIQLKNLYQNQEEDKTNNINPLYLCISPDYYY